MLANIKSIRKKSNLIGWLMMIPTLIGIAVFIVYPVFFSVGLSFTNWKFVFNNIKFTGLDNYKWVFSSDGIQFWKSISISIEFAFISTAIQTFLGFLLAYLLFSLPEKVQKLYKVLIYIPVLLPGTVISVMWTFMFEPNSGLFDLILAFFGVSNFPLWLVDDKIALWTVIGVNTWQYIGFTAIVYYIAMNSINKEILESSLIDGANKSKILWKMVFPLTISSTTTNIFLSITGGLKSFDLFYLFTNGTGDHGLYPVGLFIWQSAYKNKTFCRAVTMSLVLSVIIAIISLSLHKLFDELEKKIYG